MVFNKRPLSNTNTLNLAVPRALSYGCFCVLQDMVNKCRKNLENMVGQLEPVMVYMTVELLHLVENLHRCYIIHGDIKPDNFLILPL